MRFGEDLGEIKIQDPVRAAKRQVALTAGPAFHAAW